MDPYSPNLGETNLPTIYGAIVDYHNGLAQVRFTIAGLYIAATGFLVNSWFSINHQKSIHSYILIPILGITLALVCWLLEIRTYQLLDNLATRGYEIEKNMNISSDIGFFALMNKQIKRARWPFFKKELPNRKFFKCIVSHSFGFSLLYLVIFLFWVIVPFLKF
jgi:hypothetical protein